MKMKKYLLGLACVLFISCGGDGKSNKKMTPQKSETKKDQSTSAKDGGYGFEDLAEDLGFQTYAWSKEKDGTYFGDPKAKKGGTLNYIHSLFPRTMRIIGQNSSQVLNARTIASLCYESLLSQHPTTLDFIPKLATPSALIKFDTNM